MTQTMTDRLSHKARALRSQVAPLARPVLKERASISVVVINHNTRDQLRACLDTIPSNLPTELIVVDNASTDGSAQMVRSSYAQVTLLANQDNQGYGPAANQAIARCTASYILLLNSDTLLTPETLPALGAYLDKHPRVAIAGPCLLNSDGSLQVSCFPFPSPLPTLLSESNVPRIISHLPYLRHHYLPTWSHNAARRVPWVLGAALAIRKEVFAAVGGFDERFFMYFEEVDLCYRLQKAGWEIHFAPVASVVHLGQASTQQNRAAMAVQFYRSLSRYYKIHYGKRQMQQLKLVMAYVMIRRIIRDRIRKSLPLSAYKPSQLANDLRDWHAILDLFWSNTA